MINTYLDRRTRTEKRNQQTEMMRKINTKNEYGLHEQLHKAIIFYHYAYLGEQEARGKTFRMYNCNHCSTTLTEKHTLSHIVRKHYREGLSNLKLI